RQHTADCSQFIAHFTSLSPKLLVAFMYVYKIKLISSGVLNTHYKDRDSKEMIKQGKNVNAHLLSSAPSPAHNMASR
ncbi:MAG: hypothetical protein ACI81A_002927, partial [Paraglaciecola sp.]